MRGGDAECINLVDTDDNQGDVGERKHGVKASRRGEENEYSAVADASAVGSRGKRNNDGNQLNNGPTKEDVISGVSYGIIRSHPGNLRLYELVESNFKEYIKSSSSKSTKGKITSHIFTTMK